MEEFSLSLHPDKTRLIEFGRHAAARREQAVLGKPETFTFLGFTLICGHIAQGLLPDSPEDPQRPHAGHPQASEGRAAAAHARADPRTGQMATRRSSMGFFAYHAVPTNSPGPHRLSATTSSVLWKRTLSRRSQNGRTHLGADAATRRRLAPAAAHPSSLAAPALRRQTPKVGAECVNRARSDLCGGCAVMRIPTANSIRSAAALHTWSATLRCTATARSNRVNAGDRPTARVAHCPPYQSLIGRCRSRKGPLKA